MGMYQSIQDIVKTLRSDEDLLRLLRYKPKSIVDKRPDPLDESLPNILDMQPEKTWLIVNDTIMMTPKDDDLTDESKCRIFVYLGDRDPLPSRNSYHAVSQEVSFDIFCHVDFENGDMRSNRIADRISDLFFNKNITGLGKMNYVNGRVISRVPSQYVAYKHCYEFGGMK